MNALTLRRRSAAASPSWARSAGVSLICTVSIRRVSKASLLAYCGGCRIGLDHSAAEGSWLRPWIAAHERALYDDYGRTNIFDGV